MSVRLVTYQRFDPDGFSHQLSQPDSPLQGEGQITAYDDDEALNKESKPPDRIRRRVTYDNDYEPNKQAKSPDRIVRKAETDKPHSNNELLKTKGSLRNVSNNEQDTGSGTGEKDAFEERILKLLSASQQEALQTIRDTTNHAQELLQTNLDQALRSLSASKENALKSFHTYVNVLEKPVTGDGNKITKLEGDITQDKIVDAKEKIHNGTSSDIDTPRHSDVLPTEGDQGHVYEEISYKQVAVQKEKGHQSVSISQSVKQNATIATHQVQKVHVYKNTPRQSLPDGIAAEAQQSVVMTMEHKNSIQENFSELIDNTMPDTVLPILFNGHVFTRQEMQKIKSQKTMHEQTEEMINMLSMKNDGAYYKFVYALQNTGQDHLARRLSHDGGVVPVSASLDLPDTSSRAEQSSLKKKYYDYMDKIFEQLNDAGDDKDFQKQRELMDIFNSLSGDRPWRIVACGRGSVKFYVHCPSVEAMEDLKKCYQDGSMSKIFESFFLHMLAPLDVTSVQADTNMEKADYDNCEKLLSEIKAFEPLKINPFQDMTGNNNFPNSSDGIQTEVDQNYKEKLKLSNEQFIIGESHKEKGDWSQALVHYTECIEIMNPMIQNGHQELKVRQADALYNTGFCHHKIGNMSHAILNFSKCTDIYRELLQKVEPKYKQMMKLRVAKSLHSMGVSCKSDGKRSLAILHLTQSLNIYREESPKEEDTNLKLGFATALNDMGECWYEDGNRSKAMDHFQEAIDVYQGLQSRLTEDLNTKLHFSLLHYNIGLCYIMDKNESQALSHLSQTLEIYNMALKNGYHNDLSIKIQIANTLYWMGICQKEKDNTLGAIMKFTESVDTYKEIIQPGNINTQNAQHHFSNALFWLGCCHRKNDDITKAIQYFKECLENQKSFLHDSDATDMNLKLAINKTLHNLGDCCYQKKQMYDAAMYYKQYIENQKSLNLGEESTERSHQVQIAMILSRIGECYNDESEEALKYFQESLQLYKDILNVEGPTDKKLMLQTAIVLIHIGICYKKIGDNVKAVNHLNESQVIIDKLLAEDQHNQNLILNLVRTYEYKGMCHSQDGDQSAAILNYKNCLERCNKPLEDGSTQLQILKIKIGSMHVKLGECYSKADTQTKKAIFHYNNGLDFLKKCSDDDMGLTIVDVLFKIGQCYLKSGNRDQAVQCLKLCIAKQEELLKITADTGTELRLEMADNYFLIGNHIKLIDRKEAIHMFQQGLTKREQVLEMKGGQNKKIQLGIANITIHIGTCFAKEKDTPSALHYYQKALGIYNELKEWSPHDKLFNLETAKLLHNIGTVYGKDGNTSQAMIHYQQSMQQKRRETTSYKALPKEH